MNNNFKLGGMVAATLLGCLGLTVSAQGASFDCGKAQTKVEHLICDNPEISKLDDELSAIYKTVLIDEKQQADSLKQAQKQWLKDRNGCTGAACVKSAYETRLSLLKNKHAATDDRVVASQEATPLTQGGDWTYRDGAGRNEPLCHELLKRLNRYDRDESLDNRCSFPINVSHSQFTPPPWEELDLNKYEELFVKLMKYSGEGGPDGYFHLLTGLKQRNTESYYRTRTKRIIEEGGRLRMWRVRLVNHYGTGPIIPAPPGEQAIVQMYIPMPKESQSTYCIGKPKPASVNSLELLFIVTPDLSGPDPHVDPGTFGILGGRDLVMYEGKPLLVSSEDIWQDGKLMLDRLCNFEFVKGEK